MQKQIQELKELCCSCDEVSMPLMDEKGFNKFFGKIYSAVQVFKSQRNTEPDSANLVKLVCDLLDLAVEHHINSKKAVTVEANDAFQSTVKSILDILRADLGVDESAYRENCTTRLKINALKAFNVPFPGDSFVQSRWTAGADECEAREAESLHYARENLEEIVRFAYQFGQGGQCIKDPFKQQPLAKYLSLYERARGLNSKSLLIEFEKQSDKEKPGVTH